MTVVADIDRSRVQMTLRLATVFKEDENEATYLRSAE